MKEGWGGESLGMNGEGREDRGGEGEAEGREKVFSPVTVFL